MADACTTHPGRTSTGRCLRCGNGTCALCVLDIDGALYCSVLCFTEQTLKAKGKRLPSPDPLAAVDLQPEPSVVLTPEEAEPVDDSSVMMSAAESEDRSETSILDMSTAKRKGFDDSSIAPVQNQMKDPTSILGLGSSIYQPPKNETPLPMVLPGTRRSTIQSACVFHPDTSAVVFCSKCSDPVCTMCIADEEQGGRCSPRCRRDIRRARRKRALMTLAGAAATVLVLWWALTPGTKAPKVDPAVAAAAAAAEKAKAEADAKEAEQRRLEAIAREEARQRIEARKKEEAEKAEAEARAKAAEQARIEALARAEADAKEALEKAEAVAKAEAAKVAEAEANARREAEARAKAEADRRAKVDAEIREKEEARARAAALAKAAAEEKAREEARLKAEAAAKAAAEKKAKEEAEAKALAVETSLRKASDLIREATPEFCTLAGQAAEDEIPRVRIDAVISKLSAARSEYTALLDQGPDRPTLERRIAILGDLIDALQAYRTR
jgi:chemotaxis protein histidine kinase CheA